MAQAPDRTRLPRSETDHEPGVPRLCGRGDGEVAALPVLIRRIAARIDPELYVHVPRPVLVKRSRMSDQFGDLERAIELVVRHIQEPAGILVLLDADDDDPATLAPRLLKRVQAHRSDIPSAVVLASREYEAWFLAAAESLRGRRGLADDLVSPANPDEIRDAKGWLRRNMPGNRKYTETADQPALTDLFDLDLARSRSPSFDTCYREIEQLLRGLIRPSPPDEAEEADSSPDPT
jgi:Domain of unknown function (DUF4276)